MHRRICPTIDMILNWFDYRVGILDSNQIRHLRISERFGPNCIYMKFSISRHFKMLLIKKKNIESSSINKFM